MHGTHGASRSGEVRCIETRQCGPLGLIGKGCQFLGGVLTEEVVRDEAVRRGIVQQARAHELAERGAARRAERRAGRSRFRARSRDPGRRRAARRRALRPRPGVARTRRRRSSPRRSRGPRPAGESLALLAEGFSDQGADPGARAGDHQLRGDPQRQRKARALADESGGRLRVGVDALADSARPGRRHPRTAADRRPGVPRRAAPPGPGCDLLVTSTRLPTLPEAGRGPAPRRARCREAPACACPPSGSGRRLPARPA